jgi:CubicO group peptidase (beta-lactamase class C family)
LDKDHYTDFLRNKFSIGFFVVIMILSACHEGQLATPPKDLVGKTDSLLKTEPDFSGVILLAEKGQPVYHRAFGYTGIGLKTPMDTSAIFELASISKQFTAIVIMMLKEEGKLDYDDPLDKYLPGLPYPGIRIRNLLNHTSGLPDYMKIMDLHWDKSKVAGNDDIIDFLKKYHPPKLFNPGDKFEYSNTGYVLLASVAEHASGKNFITFCKERIFSPLKMTSTAIRTREEKSRLSKATSGSVWIPEKRNYVPADSIPSTNYNIWLGARKGPGRISSTASDLLKWDQALYSGILVSQSTLTGAFTPARLNNDSLSAYGFGWMLRLSTPYGRVVYHTGDNPGYSTEIIRYLDQEKTIIVLCNNAYPAFERIVNGMEQIFLAHH